jgi:hypothetical protein
LGLGFSAKEILTFYEDHAGEIFKGNRFLKFVRQIGFSKYPQKPLKDALESIFNTRRLGESKNRLVIPSFNLDTGEVYVYKTSHIPHLQNDYKESAVHVALATSAAPTYFPIEMTSSGIPLADGGLWANNPVGMAAVEAIGVLEWPRDDIQIVSIGCTAEPLKAASRGGLLGWGPKIADIFLASQSSASLGTAQLLVGHENVFRINPIVPNGRFGLDTIGKIQMLKGLGASEARKASPRMKRFLEKTVDPFIPSHKL